MRIQIQYSGILGPSSPIGDGLMFEKSTQGVPATCSDAGSTGHEVPHLTHHARLTISEDIIRAFVADAD
jgi:hypothetical protein